MEHGAMSMAERIEARLVARSYLYTLFHKALGGEPSEELLDAIASTATTRALDAYTSHSEALAASRDYFANLLGATPPMRFFASRVTNMPTRSLAPRRSTPSPTKAPTARLIQASSR